eukprot:TRINITY_DN2218_c0_g1_i1.p1 TRINITY_DN2218_c0_g1~~TRINITY_DN2218_c0_g1_i1.p1  ORF type:complete len:478 (+),score=58.26 TRINITY_DN2218_c0_g1_i1:37-1470(+)
MYLLLGISVVLIVLFWLWWQRKVEELTLGLPSDRIYPVIGSMVTVFKNRHRVMDWLLDLRKHGECYAFIGTMHTRAVFVFNPVDVKHFLEKNFKNYERFTNNWRFNKLFGEGIFLSNGQRWKKQRRAAHPLFTNKSIGLIQPIFAKRGHDFLDILKNSDGPLDIQDLYFRYTLDSIGEIFCGNNIGSMVAPVPFSEAFNRAQYLSDIRNRHLIKRYTKDPEFDGLLKVMDDFIYEIIDKRREQGSDFADTDQVDLLSRFMQMEDPETGEPFTRKMLKDILMNFFIAGRDTTAILLSWTTYLLLEHPEEMEKLVKEIEEVVGDRVPTSEDLSKLKLMSNVLSETLRLFPPVPSDARRAKGDDVLPSNGVVIPAKTMLVYSAWVMHRDPALWDEPNKFKPSRWEDPNVLKNPYQYVPFHAGAQTCLGRFFALTEAKTLLTMILRDYTFSLVPGQVIEPVKAIVMPAKNGIKVIARPRQK